MRTLWEVRSRRLGGSSLSVERATTAGPVMARTDVPYTFLLALVGRDATARAAHVGVMHCERRPVGVAALVGGKLRQRWWGS
jgi:hypothetical protein